VLRLVDFLKGENVTALFTSLVHFEPALDAPELSISSLMDTWVSVRDFEHNGMRTRGLCVLKSRGMPHSNRVREFVMSEKGIELRSPPQSVPAVPGPSLDGDGRTRRGRRTTAATRRGSGNGRPRPGAGRGRKGS
jgi:hypothetical protein